MFLRTGRCFPVLFLRLFILQSQDYPSNRDARVLLRASYHSSTPISSDTIVMFDYVYNSISDAHDQKRKCTSQSSRPNNQLTHLVHQLGRLVSQDRTHLVTPPPLGPSKYISCTTPSIKKKHSSPEERFL